MASEGMEYLKGQLYMWREKAKTKMDESHDAPTKDEEGFDLKAAKISLSRKFEERANVIEKAIELLEKEGY